VHISDGRRVLSILRRPNAIIFVVVLAACGQAPLPTVASGTPGSNAPASRELSSSPDSWQLVAIDAVVPPSLLTDVIATDNGFVAVGAAVENHHGTVALSSSDGLTWMAEPITAIDRTPSSLLRWGNKVVAFGAGETPCAHPFGLDTWVRDAGTWTEAPFVDELCLAAMVNGAVVGGIPVLVGTGPGDNPIAWSSTDGLHWEDHSGPFAGLLPRGVATDGSTAFAAGEGNGHIWTSSTTDGLAWTAPAPIPGLTGSISIVGMAWIGGSPTIIAEEGTSIGVIDPGTGGGWAVEPAVGLRPELLGSIKSFDGGLLAVGGDGTLAQAWVSRDGRAWRPLDLPPPLVAANASVSGIAVRDGRAVLIGSVARPNGDMVSAIWTASAAFVAP